MSASSSEDSLTVPPLPAPVRPSRYTFGPPPTANPQPVPNHSSSHPSLPFCASCHALLSHPEPHRGERAPRASRSPRRLPSLPVGRPVSPTPSYPDTVSRSASPCSSMSSDATHAAPRIPLQRSQSASFANPHHHMSHRSLSDGGSRPLPKTPASAPAFLQVPQNPAVVSLCEEHSPDLLSPAESTLSFLLPQRPADAGAIRRANLSKLRRHLGQSVPAALVAPDLEFDSDGEVSSSDDEVYADLPAARLTHASLSELTEAISPMLPALASDSLIRTYSRRWLREKKGQRWVEEDYDFILQSLRSLR